MDSFDIKMIVTPLAAACRCYYMANINRAGNV